MILAMVAPVLAAPGAIQLGFLPFAATDLPDVGMAESTARFPITGGLQIPLRWALRPGASLRFDLTLAAGPGTDDVTWTAEDISYVQHDQWAVAGLGAVCVGAEVELLPARMASPYLGAGGGGGALATFHDFGGDTALLLDAGQNDLQDPQNIDPYTLQAVPTAQVWGGVRIGQNVAFDIEAGYTVSFVSAAPLRKSPSELGARRSAYALDLLRLGVGVSVPL